MHVGLGALIVSKSDDDNAMESGVGLAVPTSVEPMPVGLARGGRYDSLVKSLCKPNENKRTHTWVQYTASVPYTSPTYGSAQMC